MTIKISTDKNGREHLVLTDESKYGKSSKGLPVANILVHAITGHVFHAPPGLNGLSRLSEAEAAMVTFWLDKVGGPHEPKIFAGNPPDG